ncbi:hypothetical protein GGH19_004882 [Coemansia sp. RSA 1807]|nr:hypothetical protein J3F81_003943 [Coemansia sp. RSA 371]KAJ2433345.1 hypothetical protein IWW41_002112 [Coemansia sp. RSA 2522]KAJ2571638.1 hypothetical protein GGH19_004882 [Coemansia sp. RSA 1807]
MFEFLYEKTVLGYFLTHDFSQYVRPLFNRLDDWQYKNYRAAGCFGKRWNKDAKEISGILRLEFVKGKDIPHTYPDTSSSRFVLVRVGNKHDYCLPVSCNNGEPRFGMISYFDNTMFDNMLVEITVVWGGAVRDSMVGRVCIPVKELHDVREYHGWLELEDSAGNPAGSVYVASKFRCEEDAGFEELFRDAKNELSEGGAQHARQVVGRSKGRKIKHTSPHCSDTCLFTKPPEIVTV